MSPRRPATPDQGQAGDPEKDRVDAKEAKEAAAVEAASEEKPKPKPKRLRRKAAAEAEGTAAEVTGVEKEVAAAAAKPTTADAASAAAAQPDEEPAVAARADVAEKPKPPRRTRRRVEEDTPAAPAAKPARTGRDTADAPPMVRAHAKYVRTSARKARLVCDHIRGKSVTEARAILAHANRDVARDWSKLLESAVANAEHNHELIGDELRIHAVKADEGPTLKRFRPRAMGRATKIRKRTSHLSITLTPKDRES
jgi:ribosomal protein L22